MQLVGGRPSTSREGLLDRDRFCYSRCPPNTQHPIVIISILSTPLAGCWRC